MRKSITMLAVTYFKLVALVVFIPITMMWLPLVALMECPNRNYLKCLRSMFELLCRIAVNI